MLSLQVLAGVGSMGLHLARSVQVLVLRGCSGNYFLPKPYR